MVEAVSLLAGKRQHLLRTGCKIVHWFHVVAW
jgi:hypothetical protein